MKAAIIIGDHPIRLNLMEQFKAKGCRVDVFRSFDEVGEVIGYGEVCILPDQRESDEDTLQRLENLAKVFPAPDPSAPKPVCHLLLHNRSSLWLLQTFDLLREIPAKFELNAFTLVDFWAKNVICQPNSNQATYPHLDRERIDVQSNKTVHLVIQGFSEMGESLAYHAALTCHFPNYERDHSLRTRITVIDENIMKRRDAFIQRYKYLFRHSYYRTIDVKSRSMTQFHEPLYNSSRENFVDVEWEFVDGSASHPVVIGKLAFWAKDPGRQLTMVVSGPDDNANVEQAIALPDALFESDTPVWVRLHRDIVSRTLGQSPRYRNIHAFGMDSSGYDVHIPVMRMSRLLHYFYACSYDARGVPTSFPQEEVEAEWRKAGPLKMRLSNVCNVQTMATKMHSLGHDADDLRAFFALTEEEIKSLARTEHNRWCVERLLSGTRACTDEERAAIRKDIRLKKEYKKNRDAHYDLCAYDELGVDEKGIDVRTYDYDLTACIPLIVESYLKEEGR